MEAEEIDLSGLVESTVDSDEEDLAESMDVSDGDVVVLHINFVRQDPS